MCRTCTQRIEESLAAVQRGEYLTLLALEAELARERPDLLEAHQILHRVQ
jgi:hypothetical protein